MFLHSMSTVRPSKDSKSMQNNQQIWHSWAIRLQNWGIHEWVAALLEGAGPFIVLGVQFIYLSEPILRLAVPGAKIETLTHLLEDPQEIRDFATDLREAPIP